MMHNRQARWRLWISLVLPILPVAGFSLLLPVPKTPLTDIGRRSLLMQAPRPTLPPRERPTLEPEEDAEDAGTAVICLGLAVEEELASPGAMIQSFLSISNIGDDIARSDRVIVPFQPEVLRVVDVRFDTPRAWVSAVRVDEIEIMLNALGPDESVTATLLFEIGPNIERDRTLKLRAFVAGASPQDTEPQLSNRVSVLIIAQAEDEPAVEGDMPAGAPPDATEPTDEPGSVEEANTAAQLMKLADVPPEHLDVTFSGAPHSPGIAVSYDGFASHEDVSLWYHRPDGAVIGLGEDVADALGRVRYEAPTGVTSPGVYHVVAYGHCSAATVTGDFSAVAAMKR